MCKNLYLCFIGENKCVISNTIKKNEASISLAKVVQTCKVCHAFIKNIVDGTLLVVNDTPLSVNDTK